ncbi:MAG: DUF4389 domain-containing protein [Candidatus Doudnabacteria bacterium]
MDQNNQAPMQNATEPNSQTITLQIPYPEQPSRAWALASLLFFVKPLLLIPHIVIMYVLSIFAVLSYLVSQIYVLFTGHYPRAIFEFMKGMTLWQMRLNSFMLGLTDQYPEFSFGEDNHKGAMLTIKRFAIAVGIIIFLIIILAIFGSNG